MKQPLPSLTNRYQALFALGAQCDISEASGLLTVILRVSQCNYGAHLERSLFPVCR
jgi:hypothetical protein